MRILAESPGNEIHRREEFRLKRLVRRYELKRHWLKGSQAVLGEEFTEIRATIWGDLSMAPFSQGYQINVPSPELHAAFSSPQLHATITGNRQLYRSFRTNRPSSSTKFEISKNCHF